MSDILIEPTATQGEYRVVGQDSSLPIPLYYGTYDECRKYIQQNFITNNNRKSCEPKLSARGNILVDQSVEVNKYSNVNIAKPLLCAVAPEEFVEDFTSDGELTPIDIVAEITGLTYNEIKSCSKVICVP